MAGWLDAVAMVETGSAGMGESRMEGVAFACRVAAPLIVKPISPLTTGEGLES